jgi:hypothetical protein
MSLTLTTNFVAQTNSVLPLAQSNSGLAVRVVSQGSNTIGTLTVTGLVGTATWSLAGSFPSWIAISVNSSGTVCTLSFSGAQYQQDPYQFFVSCTDGTNTVNFPVYLEVRTPFSIVPNSSNPVVTNPTSLNIPSYDNTIADISIQGIGLNGATQSNCNFILPSSLPAGLNFVTSTENGLILRVSEAHFGNTPFTGTDLVGGLQLFTTSPVAIPLTIQAYQPGSFYDEPDRAYPLTLSISSQTQMAGTLDFAAGAYYDTISNLLHVDAEIDVLLGTLQSQGVQVAQPLKYQWTTTGPLVLNSGGNQSGSTTNKSATYSITSTGVASVTLQVFDQTGLPIVNGLKTINLNQVSNSGGASWLSTAAIKVGVSADKKQGALGDTLTVTLSSPDGFNTNEPVYFTLDLEDASSIESALPTPTVTNTGLIISSLLASPPGNPTTTVSLQFPTGATVGNKWTLKISAANAASSPTRTGYSQVLFECVGSQPLTINGVTSTINSSTGSSITPIALSASNSGGTPVNIAQFSLIGGSEFGSGVLGAPDGIFINSQNQIAGNALTPGTYKFVVSASATGYQRSYSPVITMTVTQVSIPLQITSPTSSASSIQDNTTFNLSWGISGNPTNLFLAQIPSSLPIRTVTGAGSASVQQVGSTVYSIYGTSFYGTAYSVPLVVISSSIASATNLLPSPTIALIDENYELTANWQPFPVNGVYSAYKGWNISLASPPNTTPTVIFNDGLENGGTNSARIFEEQLTSGDYSMNMTALSANYTVALDSSAWDSNHTFPPALLDTNVTLDNTNLLLGQTLTITLNPNYAGASAWQIVFPDNTSTGWLPLSTRSVAKSFTNAGAQNIIIQTQNDFGTANPPVKLRRQLTQQVFVIDQQFNPGAAAQGALTGTLGIGGESGFEITDASTGTVTPQPYEVVIRAIARDTVTNELKLMVATSRFSNASSLLSTMAIDVFPIAGRPHAKELITPIFILEATSTTSSIPVKITTTTLPSNSFVGKPMSEFKMQASGGLQNYSWYAEGLPSGLKMNIDGTISGTPTQLGAFSVNFAVMDGSTPAYIDETTLIFTIPTDLVITTTSIPAAIVGRTYEDYTNPNSPQPIVIVNTGGLAPYTWAIVAGTSPIGISIDPSSGVLGGVPCTYNSTTDFSKTYTFTVQVTDAVVAKASKNYSITLAPAPLSFGLLNQPTIIAGEQFKLEVPVFGGFSPYTFNGFTDSGIVGTGLAIASPIQLSAIAGVTPATLSLLSTDATFYPASYPNNIAYTLTATGGVPSNASGLDTDERYKFYVDTTAQNTLPGAVCYGPLLVATPTTNGVFVVTIKVVDSVGHIATKVLNITCQAQGSGQYTLAPYVLNTLGQAPSLWTTANFTALPSGFPDPVLNAAYTPGANKYYCVALLNNGSLQFGNGSNTPMAHSIVNGALPAGSMSFTSVNSQFSATGFDAILLLQGTPTANAGASFEVLLSGIINAANASVSTAQRFSLDVGGGAIGTPVVAVTFIDALNLDLNTLVANSIGSFSWAYPLIAEGGTGPYSFSIQSGTTLPAITTGVSIGAQAAFASSTSTVGNYDVKVVATDKNGVVSAAVDIPVKIAQSTSQPIHILANNIPASLYINRAIPANTYYVESDLIANWTATGLPAGVTLSSAPGNRVYLQGTPTQVQTSTPIIFTATSATYGTQATATTPLSVAGQTATIIAPAHSGAKATIGTQYRVVNNNAIVSVQYVGFQPGDASLPLLINSGTAFATLGNPSLTIGGQPTTGNRTVTATGFIMDYDYLPTGGGTDTLSFNNGAFTDSLTITEAFPTLTVTGITAAPVTPSEYTVTQTIALPVTISGGSAPYSINISGVNDARFVAINNGTSTAALLVTVSQFAVGVPSACQVSMTVTDNAGNSASAIGTVSVNVHQETTITVVYSNYTWNISLGTSSGSAVNIVPNSLMSTPQLGHAPYSYYVDTVSIPTALENFIYASPSKRVLAFNETLAVFSQFDVDQTLTQSGSYNVAVATPPTPGTYTIAVGLRVVDSKGIVSTPSTPVNITVNIAS